MCIDDKDVLTVKWIGFEGSPTGASGPIKIHTLTVWCELRTETYCQFMF